MTTIMNMPSGWRGDLLPASFRGAEFRVEGNSKGSGRRIVVHEFPKRDYPYPEDMGRHAYTFSVRGYCIQYPFDNPAGGVLTMRDYRIARDQLIAALEMEGPGILQLPTIRPIKVVCPEYHWSEEKRLGGYVTFDMQFTEYGEPTTPPRDSASNLLQLANAFSLQAVTAASQPRPGTTQGVQPPTTNPTVPGALF